MKRVLITGAAGFLGSHLCDRFIKEDYHVIGMDNLITGDLKNIEHLIKLENFEFYHHDVSKFVHVPGETLYFSCRIAGYQKSPEEKVRLSFSVQAFDPKGVPLTELYKNEIADEVSPQDKEWMPKIETEVPIPPLVPSGGYKIVVKVEDLIAKKVTGIILIRWMATP